MDLYRSHFPSTSPHANTLAILDLPIEGSFCEWSQESFCIRLLPDKFSKFIHDTAYHSFIHGNICSIVSLDRTHLLMALGVCEQYGCQCHPQQWCLVHSCFITPESHLPSHCWGNMRTGTPAAQLRPLWGSGLDAEARGNLLF